MVCTFLKHRLSIFRSLVEESVRAVNQLMSTYKFYDNPPPIKLEYRQPSIGLIHCLRYNPGLPVFLMIPKFEMFITFTFLATLDSKTSVFRFSGTKGSQKPSLTRVRPGLYFVFCILCERHIFNIAPLPVRNIDSSVFLYNFHKSSASLQFLYKNSRQLQNPAFSTTISMSSTNMPMRMMGEELQFYLFKKIRPIFIKIPTTI